MQEWLEPVIAFVEMSIENYDEGGSGPFEATLNYQKLGLYFLVFPVKAAHLLFGLGLKVDKLLSPAEIYNDFFVGGHCFISLLVFLALLARRRLTSVRPSGHLDRIPCDLLPVAGVRPALPVPGVHHVGPGASRRAAATPPAPAAGASDGRPRSLPRSLVPGVPMIQTPPGAVVDAGARIGQFTSVWHFCHVEVGAVVGVNCNLGQKAHVGKHAIVGTDAG